jgi:hypothetical protein
MRRLFLLVLLLALAGTSWATDIKGKWGLGVGTGSFLGSSAEASLIRGKTERTAWILDVQFGQSYESTRDTTTYYNYKRQSYDLELGPRFRRFTRPRADLSPYGDFYLHYQGTMSGTTLNGTTGAGFKSGLAGGVEYFTPWHFTLAAQTRILEVSVLRSWTEVNDKIIRRNMYEQVKFWLQPGLQLRVYF